MARRLLAYLVSGALMACATPPMNVYPMAWLGLVAFFVLLRRDFSGAPDAGGGGRRALREVGRASLFGLVFGIGTNLVALRFISAVVTNFAQVPRFVGPLSVVFIAAFEGLRLAIAAGLYRGLFRLRVPPVLAFGAGMYAGTLMPSMIPWTVACGVCPWPATVQLAELVGERGVAFLMATESALAGEALLAALAGDRPRARRPALAAAALVGGSLVYGAIRIRQVDALRAAAPKERVALVVVGVEATERWDRARARDILAGLTFLTTAAESQGAQLVVWPEAAYPFTLSHDVRHSPRGDAAIVRPPVHGPILTGIILTESGMEGKTNSAMVARGDGSLSEPYDKMHLMWFGEAVPFEQQIPWLRKAFARGVGLRAGERQVALDVPPARLAVLNCLEDILPEAGREAMGVAPNLLVNLTNDAWFAGTAESQYHLLLSRLRSIETRRDLVRAVNFGPTAWVDAAGRIVAQIGGASPGVLQTEPALLDSPTTLYSVAGEWPLMLLLAGAIAGSRWAAGRATNRTGPVPEGNRPP
jgi:apolipoprotein N-acyltransferase